MPDGFAIRPTAHCAARWADLGVHGDPIHAGMTDGELARTMPTLAGQIENAEGHFHYSAPGAEGAARRDELAERLTDAGVR